MSYQPESITLYFKEGSSDKVYQTELVPSGEGWKVNFAFGRRGNSLQPGTKTTKPVTYEAAKRIYTKLISEKQAKGYSTGASGARFQNTPNESRNTGITTPSNRPNLNHSCATTDTSARKNSMAKGS